LRSDDLLNRLVRASVVTAALVISVVSVGIALTSFAVNLALSHRAAIRARKPVVVFVDDPHEDCWVLRNVGNGPALNVLVAQREKDHGWFNPVRVPPLGKDSLFPLHWLGRWNAGGLGATYSDFEDRRYTSTLGGEISCTYDGDRLPHWSDNEKEIKKYWDPKLRRRHDPVRVLKMERWAVTPSDFATGVTPCYGRREPLTHRLGSLLRMRQGARRTGHAPSNESQSG
jgi:hypothetical protein